MKHIANTVIPMTSGAKIHEWDYTVKDRAHSTAHGISAGANMQLEWRDEHAENAGPRAEPGILVGQSSFLSLMRQDVPSMTTASAWWSTRSRTAAVMVTSPLKMSVHFLKGLLVMMMVEPR